MKKVAKYVVIAAIALILAFVYYYITIPAFNIHSVGTWWFIIGAVVVIGIFSAARKLFKEHRNGVEFVKDNKNLNVAVGLATKIDLGILAVLLIILAIGALLSSPIINAKKYNAGRAVRSGPLRAAEDRPGETAVRGRLSRRKTEKAGR